jgi:hypothetical protein
MKLFRHRKTKTATTLVEVLMYGLLAAVLGAVVYHTMRTGSSLTAKNVSLNRSHEELRTALDRLANHLRMSRNVPTLLNVNGGVVATGPAAGLRYDRILGEPYVLDPVLTAGSLPATATTLAVHRSVSSLGAPPMPAVNDILIIETPSGVIRARIASVNASAAGANTQKITLGFSAPVGKALSWGVNQPHWARLVRQEAFLVVPSTSGGNELRFYPTFEPIPTLSDKTKYTVITNQIGTDAGEGTPFNVIDSNGDKMVQANMRIETRDYNRWLASRQANEMNTFFRMNLSLTSRLRPKNTN